MKCRGTCDVARRTTTTNTETRAPDGKMDAVRVGARKLGRAAGQQHAVDAAEHLQHCVLVPALVEQRHGACARALDKLHVARGDVRVRRVVPLRQDAHRRTVVCSTQHHGASQRNHRQHATQSSSHLRATGMQSFAHSVFPNACTNVQGSEIVGKKKERMGSKERVKGKWVGKNMWRHTRHAAQRTDTQAGTTATSVRAHEQKQSSKPPPCVQQR